MRKDIRLVDKITSSVPVILTLGGMVIGAIGWFIRIESRVNENYNSLQMWRGTSDQRSAERTREMEDVRMRLVVMETKQWCRENGGCK